MSNINSSTTNGGSPKAALTELDPVQSRLAKEGYPDLASSLMDSSKNELSILVDQCKNILEYDGARTVILASPAKVSSTYFEISAKELDPQVEIDKTYYVRIATNTTKKGEPVDEPFFVFDETPEVDVITATKHAMFFKANLGSSTDSSLMVSDGELDFNVNDPKYVALAGIIVKDIAEQVSPIVAKKMQRGFDADKLKDRVIRTINYFSDYNGPKPKTEADKKRVEEINNRASDRRFFTASAMGIAALWVGHVPFAVVGSGVDATLGPIPMPAPIEFMVDLNNSTDHDAQGFDMADGSKTIQVGDRKVRIPLISDYDTDGVPDATYVNSFEGPTTENQSEQSSPGMYEVDFKFYAEPDASQNGTAPTETTVVVESQPQEIADTSYESDDTYEYGDRQISSTDGCIEFSGNFTSGKTSLFTQNAKVSEKVTAVVVDQDTAKLCLTENTGEQLTGSVFVYQNQD